MPLAPRTLLTAPRLHTSIHDHWVPPTHARTNMPTFAIPAAVSLLCHLALFHFFFCAGRTHNTRVACGCESRVCAAQRAEPPAHESVRQV